MKEAPVWMKSCGQRDDGISRNGRLSESVAINDTYPISRQQGAPLASRALFQVQCKTPRQIELANSFCRYLEMARPA
jgi:hypothetical protein